MKKQPNSHHCFVCGVRNQAGVNVSFYESSTAESRDEVIGRFTGQFIHQGYPDRMHGGIVAGVLDEAIGRAINIGQDRPMVWGVTAEFTMRLKQPVPLNVELTVKGRIAREKRKFFEGTGELYLARRFGRRDRDRQVLQNALGLDFRCRS